MKQLIKIMTLLISVSALADGGQQASWYASWTNAIGNRMYQAYNALTQSSFFKQHEQPLYMAAGTALAASVLGYAYLTKEQKTAPHSAEQRQSDLRQLASLKREYKTQQDLIKRGTTLLVTNKAELTPEQTADLYKSIRAARDKLDDEIIPATQTLETKLGLEPSV